MINIEGVIGIDEEEEEKSLMIWKKCPGQKLDEPVIIDDNFVNGQHTDERSTIGFNRLFRMS